jgi:hypothetical protein
MGKKKRLTRLKIAEISAVDAAANPHAQILLRKAADSGSVTFRKGAQSWTLPADIDSLPALIDAARAHWGMEVIEHAAPLPAAVDEEVHKMDPHDEMTAIAKNYDETGELAVEIQKSDVYAALQKGAEKNRLRARAPNRPLPRS